jgi:hypothetical protein
MPSYYRNSAKKLLHNKNQQKKSQRIITTIESFRSFKYAHIKSKTLLTCFQYNYHKKINIGERVFQKPTLLSYSRRKNLIFFFSGQKKRSFGLSASGWREKGKFTKILDYP